MQFVTEETVAQKYAVCTATIRRWVKAGVFPKPVFIVGSTRWKLSDVEEFDAGLSTTPGPNRRGRPAKKAKTLDEALGGLDLTAAVSEAAAAKVEAGR